MGSNPFRPRAGRTPPVLAGRDDELDSLIRAGRRLARGEDGDERVLVAPRGYGKTALLNALEDALRGTDDLSGGMRPRIVSITAADMETVEDMLIALSSPETGQVTHLKGGGFSIAGLGGGSASRDVRVNAMTATRHLLSVHPTVLIVDEGSAMRATPARALLNAVQSVNRRSARVLLVIAGTPDTEHALNQAHATFWDKAGKTRLDLLEPDASRQAIEAPLSDRGIDIESPALSRVVEESNGYPLFVQVWGAALYEHAERTGSARITVDDINASVRGKFEKVRDDLYAQRVGEMNRQLSVAALGVASAFRDSEDGDLSKVEIWHAIDGAFRDGRLTGASTDSAYRELKHLGFFWRSDTSAGTGYRRGIPSLMDYTMRMLGPPARSEPKPPA